MMKRKSTLTSLALAMGLLVLGSNQVKAETDREYRQKQVIDFVDPKTTPKYVYVGETGHVVNPQVPHFRYGVVLTSSDESILSISDQVDWKAEKIGKTHVKAEHLLTWIGGTALQPNVAEKNKARVKFLVEEMKKSEIRFSDRDTHTAQDFKFDIAKVPANGYWDVTVIEKGSMFRLYNPNSGEHFYTASRKEAETLWGLGWQDEDIAWVSVDKNDKPVYRLYNPNAGDHHYTLDVKERDELVKLGWKYEGESWYSGGDVPLYRVYNPNAKAAGAHHFTKSVEERDALVAKGWKAEGIAWYGK